MIIENAINIYTDGASFSRPRLGGIGIRLVIINPLDQEEVEDISLAGCAAATNNQMELKACIKGLKEAMRHPAFDSFGCIAIHSDSQYVVENYKRAFYAWSKNKWCNYQGKPVDNATLWKKLLHTVKKCYKRVDFYWVKGLAKNQQKARMCNRRRLLTFHYGVVYPPYKKGGSFNGSILHVTCPHKGYHFLS